MTRSFALALLLCGGAHAARQHLGALLDEAVPENSAVEALHSRAHRTASPSSLAAQGTGQSLESSLGCKGCRNVNIRVEMDPPSWPLSPAGEQVVGQINSDISGLENMANSNNEAFNALTNARDANLDALRSNRQNLNSARNQLAQLNTDIGADASTLSNLRSQVGDADALLTNRLREINNAQNLANAGAAQTAANTQRLSTLASSASTNSARIAANTQALAGASAQQAMNTANIAANSNAINVLGNGIAANTQRIADVGSAISTNTAGIDHLATAVDANSRAVVSLSSQVSMISGSIAANTDTIRALSSQVDILQQAGGPTIALAGALGLPVSTVSSLALAGSFVGPALGTLALVYVCWPTPRSDPWWQMEARVAQLIDDKFVEERRKRLSARLKRYLRAFSRCSAAWVKGVVQQDRRIEEEARLEEAMDLHMGVNWTSSMMQIGLHHASRGDISHEWSLDDAKKLLTEDQTGPGHRRVSLTSEVTGVKPTTQLYKAAPPCMAQLEGHMSLERDEWMKNDGNTLSGLFMPFANMHTQVQHLLMSYPTLENRFMKWDSAAESTAAEYAHFMMEGLVKGWHNQVCRTARLRYTVKGGLWWKYFLTVLEPVYQPHAGEECWEKCGGKSGWCDFCGGLRIGACCKKGAADKDPPEDPSECKDFDPPVKGFFGGAQHVCVHAECGQTNTEYRGVQTVAKYYQNSSDWKECQDICRSVPRTSYFLVKKANSHPGYKCKCQAPQGQVSRIYVKDSTSGPKECPHERDHDEVSMTEEMKQATPKVPMHEVRPCEKSPSVGSLQELHDNHEGWIKRCYANATTHIAGNYNPFFKRFARFIDQLANYAHCDEYNKDYKYVWRYNPEPREDYTEVGQSFDAVKFSTCNWERETSRDDGKWVNDEERVAGMLGLSKIDLDEQWQLKVPFPQPKWLERRQQMMGCLLKKFPGGSPGDEDELQGLQQEAMNSLV